MSRELDSLIRTLESLSPADIARVTQFMAQLNSTPLRILPAALTAVPRAGETFADEPFTGSDESPMPLDEPRLDGDVVAGAADPSALWRRRPFQAINDDDLQPIAALFREAVDSRAAARQRFGAR